MANLLFYIVHDRLFPPSQVSGSFANKTVIVTGSNSGLGFETALKYAELGASTVILAVRSLDKGREAQRRIEEKTRRKDVIKVWQLDMNSSQSIDAFARRVDNELEQLDIVVLNAGLLSKTYQISSEGWENTLQVNTVSTALLSLLLIPKLKASGTISSPAHLEVVSSFGHINAIVRPADKTQRLHAYNTSEGFGTGTQYDASKLFIMWFQRELAKRTIAEDGSPQVIINDTCPGGNRTEVLRDFSNVFYRVLIGVVSRVMWKPAEQGARTLVKATQLGKESHGRWWVSNDYMT